MWWLKQSLMNIWLAHLPKATGPFMPGCMDLMFGYNKEDPFVRLYYPTTAKKDSKDNASRFVSWIQDISYLAGFSRVVMIHNYVSTLLLWWIGIVRIPVLYGVKVKTDEKLKCIVMSHGLGGTKFLYSNTCCELASRGFLVICLEHRDLTAAFTYYYASREDAVKDKRTPLLFRHTKFGKNHYPERNRQIKIRSEECNKVVDFLINLNKGVVPDHIISEVPTRQEILFDLADLVGKLDMDSLTMMGHSMGAATALYVTSKRKELKQCILLDPWMFPIKNEDLHEEIEQPLLFINTQTFHVTRNVNAMSKFLKNDNREMYTIRHTTHEIQTDTALLMGYWLNWFMKKLDPDVALRINNALIMRFLNRYVGCPVDIVEDKTYLEEQKDNIESGLTEPWA